MRRPEPAGRQHQVDTGCEQLLERADDGVLGVVDGDHPDEPDAVQVELSRQVRRVGVDRPAEQDLGARHEDGGARPRHLIWIIFPVSGSSQKTFMLFGENRCVGLPLPSRTTNETPPALPSSNV